MGLHYKYLRALPEISSYMRELNKPILRFRDMSKILADKQLAWDLPYSATTKKLISLLEEHADLEVIDLKFPSRREKLYSWGEVSGFQIAMALKQDAYFSHYSAMSIHDLTDQVPKTIYLNSEQPPKLRTDSNLDQARIDAAFERKPRRTNNIATLNDTRICLLNGMHTGNLGVETSSTPEGNSYRVTNIERTLIDIAVRPFYAGGVFEIRDAYRKAAGKANIELLVEMLTNLKYAYPYHQSIGFYLEKSGTYRNEEINLLQGFGFQFDFYLTNQIQHKEYSDKWRLFYPKGF